MADIEDSKPSKKGKKAKRDKKEKPAGPKSAGLFSSVAKASPYTMMLAISVVAIGIAIVCLVMEWNSYGRNRKPPKSLTMSRTVEAVPLLAAIDDPCDYTTRTPAGFDPWPCG